MPDGTAQTGIYGEDRTLRNQRSCGRNRDTAILQAAATDGIVMAVRAEGEHPSGEMVTVLGVLNSRAQLDLLAAMRSDPTRLPPMEPAAQ